MINRLAIVISGNQPIAGWQPIAPDGRSRQQGAAALNSAL
jgi:hypothetical protein